MIKRLLMTILLSGSLALAAIAQVPFGDYFEDKALRLDFFHVGDAKEETITPDRIFEEALWPGSRSHLLDPFNSRRYGGGSIGFDYCVTTVDHAASRQVFVHEFGHSFAGLADEYYQSEIAYNDFYPKGVEPLEPNITALLDPANIKWKELLSPGISLPTEYGKEKIETLQAERRKNREAQAKAIEQAKQKGTGEAEVKKIEAKFREADKTLTRQIENVRKQYESLSDKVGAFEGASYASKGLFRPMMYCLMISSPKNEFCLVCQRAIARMIDYYAPVPGSKGLR